ncbi:hypothetical protein AB3N59_19605 [Leptospira sp. WS92.C1]
MLLRDLEEQIFKIKNPILVDYMKEALNCYNSKSFRATIIVSSIALFEDIFIKLGYLANINHPAKVLLEEVKKRREDQNIYEVYMLDQLKSLKILSELDYSMLEIVRNLRNKSAHPSGHNPSPEEARYIFNLIIDNVLSKESLTTKESSDFLLSRLGSVIFFPDSGRELNKKVVVHEISTIHPEAYDYLLSKLFDRYLSITGTEKDNILRFLTGMLDLGDEPITSKMANQIERNLEKPNAIELILSLVTIDANILTKLKKTLSRDRLKVIFKGSFSNFHLTSQISLSHPANIMKSIMKTLNSEEIITEYWDLILVYAELNSYDNSLIEYSLMNNDLKIILKNKYMKSAGSSFYETSNMFCLSLERNEELILSLFTNDEIVELFIRILSASYKGAWEAQRIIGNKLNTLTRLKRVVLEYESNTQREKLQIILDTHYSGNLKADKLRSLIE